MCAIVQNATFREFTCNAHRNAKSQFGTAVCRAREEGIWDGESKVNIFSELEVQWYTLSTEEKLLISLEFPEGLVLRKNFIKRCANVDSISLLPLHRIELFSVLSEFDNFLERRAVDAVFESENLKDEEGQ